MKKVRELERVAFFQAKVVDKELLEQGAPPDVMLQFLTAPTGIRSNLIARALEVCLVDHPRLQLVHSVALPFGLLSEIQPAEASPILPPLHFLPLCDEIDVIVLVKEHSDGTPLLTWRQARAAKLKLTDVSDLLETCSEAIASLHRRGYAHGSLTPDSIVLQQLASPTSPGDDVEMVWVPKIIDLGLTRTLASPGTWPAGAPALWCAPEAFEPDPNTDWRKVDQLSLAAMLYALWTDRVPFDAVPAGTPPAAARDLRKRQIEGLPPPRGNDFARSLGVTPAMSAACMRAMSAEPADRFPSMDALSSALRAAAREAGRRSPLGEDDPTNRDNTSPGSNITSRFRLSQQAKVSATPMPSSLVVADLRHEARTEPPVPRESLPGETNPGAKIEVPAKKVELPGKEAAAPPDDDTSPGASIPEAGVPWTHKEQPGFDFHAGFQGDPHQELTMPLKPDRDLPHLSELAGAAAPEPEATAKTIPTRQAHLLDHPVAEPAAPPVEEPVDEPADAPRVRKTKILSDPGRDDGNYPVHPDEDRERAPDEEDHAAAFGPPPSKWAFNYLTALLLALWLVTLAWGFLKSGGDASTRVPSAKASKSELRKSATADE